MSKNKTKMWKCGAVFFWKNNVGAEIFKHLTKIFDLVFSPLICNLRMWNVHLSRNLVFSNTSVVLLYLACGCNVAGAQTDICDPETGNCPCVSSFGGRTCDQCNNGYYGFPGCTCEYSRCIYFNFRFMCMDTTIVFIPFLYDLRHSIASHSDFARVSAVDCDLFPSFLISCLIPLIHELAKHPLSSLPGRSSPEPS